MKRWYANKMIWAFSVVLVGMALLSAVRIMEAKSLSERRPASKRPVKVKTAVVARGSIEHWVSGEGTARAVRREFLTFENQGRVVFLGEEEDGTTLREGSPVKGPDEGEALGQLIARVDSRDQLQTLKVYEAEMAQATQGVQAAEAQVEQARVELELRESNFKRAQELYRQGAYALSRFESEKSACYSARSALQGAKARLKSSRARISAVKAQVQRTRLAIEKTSIFAPFDGVITRMNIRVGDYASLNPLNTHDEATLFSTAAVVVVDPTAFEVTLDLPLYYGAMVKEGQAARVRFSGMALPGESATENVSGRVYSVTPAVTPGKRTIRVRIRTDKDSQMLIDGSYVMGRVAVEKRADAILVPRDSLLFENSRPYLFVVNPETKRVTRQSVVMGIQEGEETEIVEGLSEGALVVTQGKYRLVDGAAVEIVYDGRELSRNE